MLQQWPVAIFKDVWGLVLREYLGRRKERNRKDTKLNRWISPYLNYIQSHVNPMVQVMIKYKLLRKVYYISYMSAAKPCGLVFVWIGDHMQDLITMIKIYSYLGFILSQNKLSWVILQVKGKLRTELASGTKMLLYTWKVVLETVFPCWFTQFHHDREFNKPYCKVPFAALMTLERSCAEYRRELALYSHAHLQQRSEQLWDSVPGRRLMATNHWSKETEAQGSI